MEAFTDSGTYAPTYLVAPWRDDDGQRHLFLVDGYAASAEAVQAASLAPLFGLEASLAVFTSRFELSYERERRVMHLDPDHLELPRHLGELTGTRPDEAAVADYRGMIRDARAAGLPLDEPVMVADDFFPEKRWDVLALCGYMRPDPYSCAPGVEEVAANVYRTTVRFSTPRGDKRITFTLRLMEEMKESRLIFNPLLIRFFQGEDYKNRAVKISDSGRIRNELQTLCSEAIEHMDNRLRVLFDRIPDEVISPENRAVLLDVLRWYKQHHPIWFRWLEIEEPRWTDSR
jgi:hypothetical protein